MHTQIGSAFHKLASLSVSYWPSSVDAHQPEFCLLHLLPQHPHHMVDNHQVLGGRNDAYCNR
jgi:hypothetical protein